jgi:hypothetical protein
MRAVVALLALALALLAASCSHRERANPLDAANPDTGGAPQGFNAVADAALVQLRWVARPDLAIDGFQIFRLAPGDSIYRALSGVLLNVESRFYDSTAQPGLEYRYRIYYVIGGALGAKFAEDVAAPGPLSPWVVDAGRGRLLRLSPDGRDVLIARPGFNAAGSIAVTPGRRPVWVGDELAGTVDIVDPGDLLGPTPARPGARPRGSRSIRSMAQPGYATAPVRCSTSCRAAPRRSPASLTLLDDPAGIATDPESGAVWVTEFGGNRVRRYQRDGLPIGARAPPGPRARGGGLDERRGVGDIDRERLGCGGSGRM